MTEITDQMIETAARAIARNWGLDPDDHIDHEHFHEDAITALTAVAPLIVAQALRHEADNAPSAWEVPVGVWYLDRTSRNYLRARAEQIEGGQ